MESNDNLDPKVKCEIIFNAKDVQINLSHPISNQTQKNMVVKALLAAANAIIDNPLPVIQPANLFNRPSIVPNGKGRLLN